MINTGKARWLISRALALGFYPDGAGGDTERRRRREAAASIECDSMKINTMFGFYLPAQKMVHYALSSWDIRNFCSLIPPLIYNICSINI